MNENLWVTVFPILLINISFLVTFLYFFARYDAITPHKEMDGRHDSRLLNRFFKGYWYWLTEPIVKLLIKLRMSPNMITLTGFLISCSAAFFFAKGLFGYAGWTMIFGATFDMFDGRVARAIGRQTRSGAFFDSVMDRFGEGYTLLGLAFYYHASWLLGLVILCIIGSTMVSYTRARGEGVGIDCKVGPMQRPERIVYLGVASSFTPLVQYVLALYFTNPPAILVIAALIMITVLTHYTAVYRMIYIMNAIDTKDRQPNEVDSLPQILTKLKTKEGREEYLHRFKQDDMN